MPNKKKISKSNKALLKIGIVVLIGLVLLYGGYIYKQYRQPIDQKLEKLTKNIQCSDCNVVLISLDTLRSQELPCYGYYRNTASQLCGYADKNVFFKNNYSNAPFTLPSHFSIFTSLIPDHHHMNFPGDNYLNPEIITLTQTLKKNGYETMFVGPVNNDFLPLTKGLERGFDIIQDNPTDNNGIDGWKNGLNKLYDNSVKNKPTFLFLHTYAIHDYLYYRVNNPMYVKDNYMLQQKFKKIILDTGDEHSVIGPAKANNDLSVFRYLQDLYDDRIYDFDVKLKSVFDILNNKIIKDKTIVIVTADHGNEFLEHGDYGRGKNLYNTSITTPLIISVPNIAKSQINELTESIDIYPTILGLTGIKKPNFLEGNDLTNLIRGKSKTATDDFLIANFLGDNTIISGNYKLYYHGDSKKYELFNLAKDPGETTNISLTQPELVNTMSRIMNDKISKHDKFAEIDTQFPRWIGETQLNVVQNTDFFKFYKQSN